MSLLARATLGVALFACGLAAPLRAAPAPDAKADSKADIKTDTEEEPQTQAPLTVGSMAIASDPALAIEAMAVDVTGEQVTYAYRLRNKGPTKLSLAASVAMPDLEVSSDAATVHVLPNQNAENPVDLVVKANDKPIVTTPALQAVALGIDRLGDLRAEHLPIIPFGPDIEKALASAKPDTLSKLESLGLVTPRDPSQPDTPILADWSLRDVQGWMQPLEPNTVTNVTVAFKPVKATYVVDADNLADLDAIKDQVCLTPQATTAAKALLKAKGSTVQVVDITLANDGPARWLDNPPATIAVRKPKPSSVVVFCGIDGATAGQAVVRGKMPGSGDAGGVRVLVFSSSDR